MSSEISHRQWISSPVQRFSQSDTARVRTLQTLCSLVSAWSRQPVYIQLNSHLHTSTFIFSSLIASGHFSPLPSPLPRYGARIKLDSPDEGGSIPGGLFLTLYVICHRQGSAKMSLQGTEVAVPGRSTDTVHSLLWTRALDEVGRT